MQKNPFCIDKTLLINRNLCEKTLCWNCNAKLHYDEKDCHFLFIYREDGRWNSSPLTRSMSEDIIDPKSLAHCRGRMLYAGRAYKAAAVPRMFLRSPINLLASDTPAMYYINWQWTPGCSLLRQICVSSWHIKCTPCHVDVFPKPKPGNAE